jgi:hypothetical protein
VKNRIPIRLRIRRTILLSAVACLSSVSRLLAQCAMCSGAVGAGADAGRAYNSSTVFMLAVPYLLLLGVLGYVVHAFRRPPAKADVAGSDLPPDGPSASS